MNRNKIRPLSERRDEFCEQVRLWKEGLENAEVIEVEKMKNNQSPQVSDGRRSEIKQGETTLAADTQLKTLKDLRNFGRSMGKTGGDNSWVFTKELRAEAVEWVRHLRNERVRLKDEEEQVLATANQEFWIINFFNLTEEDLK